MKSLRVFALLFTISVSQLSHLAAGESKAEKPCESACECPKDKDGKACGVDKDCCCTGKKAQKKD